MAIGKFYCTDCKNSNGAHKSYCVRLNGNKEKIEVTYLISRLQKEQDKNLKLMAGIKSVRELMNESFGVAGLHKNGEIAAWDTLEKSGSFEEWLLAFNEAEDVLDT